jgi:hypothetical protein
MTFYLPSTINKRRESQAHLINRRVFAFLTIMMVFTANIVFIFSYYTENVLAGDISYSVYKSVLTVGTKNNHINLSDNSSIVKTIQDDKGNTFDDIPQITIIKDKLIYLSCLGFLQKFIDRFLSRFF